MLAERDAEIALSPGFRWGGTLIPGQAVTWEDVYNATAITYPAAYRSAMSGETIKVILEDVADNLFNPDPYYQQGGDMVRVGRHGLYDQRRRRDGPAHHQHAPAEFGRADRGRARTMSWRAGAPSTRVRKARRSGMSSPLISRAGRLLSPEPRKSVKIVRAGG